MSRHYLCRVHKSIFDDIFTSSTDDTATINVVGGANLWSLTDLGKRLRTVVSRPIRNYGGGDYDDDNDNDRRGNDIFDAKWRLSVSEKRRRLNPVWSSAAIATASATIYENINDNNDNDDDDDDDDDDDGGGDDDGGDDNDDDKARSTMTTTKLGQRRLRQRRLRQRRRRRRRVTKASLSQSHYHRQMDDLFSSWSESKREILIFAITNRTLFTVGGHRSILRIYHSLLRIVYDKETYGRCNCYYERQACRYMHITRDIASYPSKPHGDTIARYAFQISYRTALNTIELTDASLSSGGENCVTAVNDAAAAAATMILGGDGITIQSNTRVATGAKSDEMYHRYMVAPILDIDSRLSRTEWFCNVRLRIPRDRDPSAAVTDESNSGIIVEKLLDHRFTSAAEAWLLIVSVMEWCAFVHKEIGLYPVRRSVWDLLFCSTNDYGAIVASSSRWRVVGANGLIDVGHVCAYVYTLRVFILMIYLGCSYGGIVRSASVNDRVSNRSHNCVFPSKTSGVYHSLFHTSIVPHKLLCAQYGTRRGGRDGAKSANSDLATSRYPTAEDWLEDLCVLCNKACDRYDLPRVREESLSLRRNFE